MRRIACVSGLTVLLLILAGQSSLAQEIAGLVKLGAIAKDEEGTDMTAIQETVNIHDGFAVSRVDLRGDLGGGRTFRLDLTEPNLDSRRGHFSFRSGRLFDLQVRYSQHRRLFDTDGTVQSERENWVFRAGLRPAAWLSVNGDYNRQSRDGGRLGHPLEAETYLGGLYDYTLNTGGIEVEARSEGRAAAVGYQRSHFEDGTLAAADRTGQIFHVRANLPCYLFPGKASHFLRGSFGTHELDQSGLQYEMSTFQYVGTARPGRALQADYRLYLSRVKDDATGLQTDEVRNDFDLTWSHRHGKFFGGYGYSTHDSDRSLTDTDVWRLGMVLADGRYYRAKAAYASSEKTDTENLTLLKDIEASRLRVSFDVTPEDRLGFGTSFAERKRTFPIIDVESKGRRFAAHGRYSVSDLGALQLDYSYTNDRYLDQGSAFVADTHAASFRLDVTRIRKLKLSAGVTYLDVGKDLDIEKSILCFDGEYALNDDYSLEVKYNAYNYDDFVLMDRYYTANVVWVNIGYKFTVE